MKTIYLWVTGEGYKGFKYESLEDIKNLLDERGITIGCEATIGVKLS